VELARVAVEHHRQPPVVAVPHRYGGEVHDGYPGQRALGVAFVGGSGETVHPEHEAEPAVAAVPEAGPVDRAAQGDLVGVQAGLLADLPPDSADHVLVRLHPAAEAEVLAVVDVVRPLVAVDQEHP
jgi:hypothetical protein